MSKREAYLGVLALLVVAALVVKLSITSFVSYNLPEDVETTENFAELVSTISNAPSLEDLIFNWDGKDYPLIDNSLVLMYNFDDIAALGENDTRIVDVSGHGNNGTIYPGASYTTGKYGKALYFNGSGYVDAGNSSSLNITGDVTISAWVRADDAPVLGGVKDWVKINDTSLGGGVLEEGGMFGQAVTSLGDLDEDGIGDLAVAAKRVDEGGIDVGAVYILFMNQNGTVKNWTKINDTSLGGDLEQNDWFGQSINYIGDLNKDGIGDLAVGAIEYGGLHSGKIYILFMNQNGTVKNWTKINNESLNGILGPDDWFGTSISSVCDLDNDGILDLAVGASRDDDGVLDAGAIYILFMNQNGTVKNWTKINDTSLGGGVLNEKDKIGFSLSLLDCSTLGEYKSLVSGAINDDDGATDAGAVFLLFLYENGTVRSWSKITSPFENFELSAGDQFGVSVDVFQDFEGEGALNLICGSKYDGSSALRDGAMYVVSFYENLSEKGVLKLDLTSFLNELEDLDGFGFSLSSMGDFDNEGIYEVIAGARTDDDGATDAGAVYILSIYDGPGKIVYKNNSFQFGLGQTQIKSLVGASPMYVNRNVGSGWNHVVMTSDGSEKKIYLNGKLISTSDSEDVPSSVDHLFIGKNFNGTIDELKIWNRSLSSSEVDLLYRSNLKKESASQWKFWLKKEGLDYGKYEYYFNLYNGTKWIKSAVREVVVKREVIYNPFVSYPAPSLLKKGYNKKVEEGHEIRMTIKGEKHSLKVAEVHENKVVVVISSEPRTYELGINETKKVDLEDDGIYDLRLYLKGIDDGKADLEIKEINESYEIHVDEEKAVENDSGEKVVDEDVGGERHSSGELYRIIGGLIVLAVIIWLVIFIILKEKDREKDEY